MTGAPAVVITDESFNISAVAKSLATTATSDSSSSNDSDNVALCTALVALSKQLPNANLAGRTVLLRLDLNAPTDAATGAVVDDSRIAASMPVIDLLRAKNARVVVASHFGRPDPNAADVAAERARHTLAPVAAVLARRLPPGSFAGLAPTAVGPAAAVAVAELAPGQVLLLENLRLHAGEAANDPAFAAALAALAEVYVGDAFGVTHRAHASVSRVPALMSERYPGPLIAAEAAAYLTTMARPARPLGVAIGGAKVKDKIGVLRSLLARADVVVVGGRMAFTLLAGFGVPVGRTAVEAEWLGAAREMVAAARARGVKLLLPVDALVSDSLEAPANARVVPLPVCAGSEAGAPLSSPAAAAAAAQGVPAGAYAVDIGPATAAAYHEALARCGTLLWNGPMGRYEVPEFSAGTCAVIRTLTDATRRGAATCLGGGDSLAAFAAAGPGAGVGFASTGGGASLELLEGRTMPGLRALLPTL